ncbi:hypothetical protein T439DRAFT_87482 [Meredithblackwellia eburnea MCA 4105]
MHDELEKRDRRRSIAPLPRRSQQSTSTSSSSRHVSVKGFFARVAIFYLLIAYFLVCPTDTTRERAVCRGIDQAQLHLQQYEPVVRPYIQLARRKIQPYTSQIQLHVQPYLNQARPYYQQADKWLRPHISNSAQLYTTHAHPVILSAISRSQKATKPHLDNLKSNYQKTLGPSVEWYSRALRDSYKTHAKPHVDTVSRGARLTYDRVSPAYPWLKKHYFGTVLPSSQAAYRSSRKVYVTHVHPRAVVAGGHAHAFWKGKALPALQRFYSLYIAPQVGQIKAKIFEYRTKKERQEAVAKVVEKEHEIVKEHGGEDFEDFIAELRDETYATTTSAVSPSSTATDAPTPEELKAQTAQKRATLEALQDTYERSIAKLGQVEQDLLVQRLVDIRRSAVEDIPMRFDSVVNNLDEEGDKVIGKLGKYFDKVSDDEKLSVEEKVEESDFLATKAIAKVQKLATDAKAEVAKYEETLEDKEKEAVTLAASALSTLVSKAQEELSFGWTWLDDVRHADWQRFHQLAKVESKFKDYYSGIQSGAIKDSALSEFKPVLQLRAVEKEVDSTVDAFEKILSKIKIRGQKELKGEWTGVANEAAKAYDAASNKVGDFVDGALSSASSLAGITPTPTDIPGSASSLASVAQELASSLLSSAYEAIPTLPPVSLPTEVIAESYQSVTEGLGSAASQAASVVDAASSVVVTNVPAALESVISLASSLGEGAYLGAASSASQLASGASEKLSTAASVVSSYASPHSAFSSAATPIQEKVSSVLGEASQTIVAALGGEPSPTDLKQSASSIASVASSVVSSYIAPSSAAVTPAEKKIRKKIPKKVQKRVSSISSAAESMYGEASQTVVAALGGEPSPTNVEQSASSVLAAVTSKLAEATQAAASVFSEVESKAESIAEEASSTLSAAASVINSYAAPHPAYAKSSASAAASRIAHAEL